MTLRRSTYIALSTGRIADRAPVNFVRKLTFTDLVEAKFYYKEDFPTYRNIHGQPRATTPLTRR